ncbi:MAG: DUF3810 domain-containing protein [Ruminococcaceae bacterium]|nr:DUF3810 domain-containing protein [Oscillospiraceae bacterium]
MKKPKPAFNLGEKLLPQLLARWKLLLPLAVAIVLVVLARLFPGFANLYMGSVYRVLAAIFVNLFGLLPFSVAEFVAYLLPLVLLFFLVRFIIRVVRARGLWYRQLGYSFFRGVVCVGMVALVFIAGWGVSYYRYPFAQLANLPVQAADTQELAALCTDLGAAAGQLRTQVAENEDGVFTLPYDRYECMNQVRYGYAAAAEAFPALAGTYARPKPVLASRALSALDISGIYIPFTFEANVNADMPAAITPFTASHEAAHALGFGREDESNFIAYLACKAHPDVSFRYSGTLYALIYALNALYDYDPSGYYDIVYDLDAGILRDLEANRVYWQQFEGPLQEVQSSINDAYLKANGQTEGVRSYGRMVDLLLAYRRTGGMEQAAARA